MLVRPKEGMSRTPTMRAPLRPDSKSKNSSRCHPADSWLGPAVLVVCALSTGRISRAWIASLNFFSPQPVSWMCGVSYYASSAAVNPEHLATLPRIDMESSGSRLYISAVPSSSQANRAARPGYSFPLAAQRVASRLASPCHGLPAPLEMGPRTELLGQRAADACVSGCPRSYRGLQKVEICRPDTGHLRHQ